MVASVTSLFSPPITPASPTVRSESAITHIEASSVRRCPSSVVNGSAGRARRTMIVASVTRAASKAWSGCPSSHST